MSLPGKGPQIAWTINQLFKVTGLDRATLAIRLAHLKPEIQGRDKIYHAPHCFKAILISDKRRNEDKAGLKLLTAKANREERKDRMEDGEIISISDAHAELEDMQQSVKQKMLSLGNNLQSILNLDEAGRKTVDRIVRDILVELSKPVEFSPKKEDENVTDHAA